MQPYQRANEEIKRRADRPINALKSIGSIAATGGATYGAGSLVKKASAFLSKYIPEDLAIKGLSKLDPRFGKFIEKALENEVPFEEVKEFIGEKLAGNKGQKKQEGKEKRNIIEQYDPELHTYIQEKIKSGESPIAAGEKAKGHRRFDEAIKKITKDHKRPWADILQEIYGMANQQQAQQQQQPQPEQQMAQPQQQARPHPNSAQGQQLARQQAQPMQQQAPQPQQGQPGQGQQIEHPNLLSIMNKISQKMGV